MAEWKEKNPSPDDNIEPLVRIDPEVYPITQLQASRTNNCLYCLSQFESYLLHMQPKATRLSNE